MKQSEIFFNFHGIGVRVISGWTEIVEKLQWDFSEHLALECQNLKLSLEVHKDLVSIPCESSWVRATKKVKFLEEGSKRVSYYGGQYSGEVRSEMDFDSESAKVFGQDENLVHEICYLLILTRVGRALDEMGVHRFHAFGFVYDKKLILGLFPSGTGKTTFLSHLLAQHNCEIISDDSPIIDSKGKVHPFIIRLGFESEGVIPDQWKDLPFYFLERRFFGMKKLISFKDITYKVANDYDSIILLRISHRRENQLIVKKELGLIHAFQLFKEGAIGMGLPMLFEYYWEFGFKDFWKKIKIFFSRVLVLGKLWIKAKKYKVAFTNDPNCNVENFLNNLKNL